MEEQIKFPAKQYLDLAGLQAYDALIKGYVNNAAESAQTAAVTTATEVATAKASAAQTAAVTAATEVATAKASAAQTAAYDAAVAEAANKASAAQTAAVNAAADQLEGALANYKVKDIDNTASTNIVFGVDTDGKLSGTVTGVVLADSDYENVKTNANNSALAWNTFLANSSITTPAPTLAQLATKDEVANAQEAAIAEAANKASAAQTAAVTAATEVATAKASAAQTAAYDAAKGYTDEKLEAVGKQIDNIVAGGVSFIGVVTELPAAPVNGNLFVVGGEGFTVGEIEYKKDYEYIYDSATETWYELGDSSKNGKAIAALEEAYKAADAQLKSDLEAADANLLEAINNIDTAYKAADTQLKSDLEAAYEAADTELYNSITAIPTSAISALFTTAQ